MFKMKNIFVLSIVLSVFAVSAAAQDLDPTVEVSREYEGKLVEAHKPVFKMAVPDSITRFALDFDYYVNENPYKGSYDFDPYLLIMKPSSSESGENRFYLRAGVGYQPHPVLDMVWSPKFKKQGFNMDVYGMHRSFIGKYLKIVPYDVDDKLVLTNYPKDENGYVTWSGYDMLSKAGVVFRHDWDKMALDYSAGYYGLAQKDPGMKRLYNAADASVGIHTKPESRENLKVDADLDYRFGEDAAGTSKLYENLASLKVEIGQIWKNSQSMNIGLEANAAYYSSAFDLFAGDVSLTPRYVYTGNRFTADLGLKVSKLLTREDLGEQYVYPAVNVSYLIVPEALKLFVKADGGGNFDSYSSTIASSHHVTHLMSSDIVGYTVERVGLTAGLDGRLTDMFKYNIRGGYANYASYRHYAVVPSLSLVYAEAQKWFAALDWVLDVEDFRFDGSVSYDHFWGDYRAILRPSALTGRTAVEYNWRKRVMCGIEADFATASRMTAVSVPGYVDLGAYAEYATAWGLSFWLSAGNLLNQTIQRTPFYAEKGVFFTAGICLNL